MIFNTRDPDRIWLSRSDQENIAKKRPMTSFNSNGHSHTQCLYRCVHLRETYVPNTAVRYSLNMPPEILTKLLIVTLRGPPRSYRRNLKIAMRGCLNTLASWLHFFSLGSSRKRPSARLHFKDPLRPTPSSFVPKWHSHGHLPASAASCPCIRHIRFSFLDKTQSLQMILHSKITLNMTENF
jgi:hypothetical protein